MISEDLRVEKAACIRTAIYMDKLNMHGALILWYSQARRTSRAIDMCAIDAFDIRCAAYSYSSQKVHMTTNIILTSGMDDLYSLRTAYCHGKQYM